MFTLRSHAVRLIAAALLILFVCVTGGLAQCDPNTTPAYLGPFEPDMRTLLLYHMDESDGADVYDSSDYARDGVMTETLVNSSPRIAGQAGFGNAVNYALPVASDNRAIIWDDAANNMNLQSLDEFTIEFWMRPLSFGNDDYFWAIGPGAGACLAMKVPSDVGSTNELSRINLYMYSSAHRNVSIDLSEPLTVGEWQHVGLVYRKTETGSRFEVYRNANLIGSADLLYGVTNNSPILYVGQYAAATWYRQFQGDMDEFRISDIARNWRCEEGAEPPTVVGMYDFDVMVDSSGDPAFESSLDSSGNDMHLVRNSVFGSYLASDVLPPYAPDGSLSLHSAAYAVYTDPTDLFSIGRTGGLTMEFWYKPMKIDDAAAPLAFILGHGTLNNSWTLTQRNLGDPNNVAVRFYATDGAGGNHDLITAEVIPANEWSHLAVRVSDSGTANIYLNGSVIASLGGFTGFDSRSASLVLGENPAGGWVNDFYIDDLRISDGPMLVGSGDGMDQLAYAATLSQSRYVKARPKDFGRHWLRTHPFMINCWPVQDHFDAFKAANFTTALGGYHNMEAIGLNSHYIGGDIGTWGEDDITRVQLAMNNPSLNGWEVRDEMPPDEIPVMGQFAEHIRKFDPDGIIYAGLGGTSSPYPENVIAGVQPDAIIHGGYIFKGSSVEIDWHFADLMIYRSHAMTADLPFFSYIQSFDDQGSPGDRRLPSESELRFDLFSKLAAGVQGVCYFVFDTAAGGDLVNTALYDATGNPSPLYAPAVQANAEVANVGQSLRAIKTTAYHFVPGTHDVGGSPVKNTTRSGLTDWTPGVGGDSAIQSIDVLEQGEGKDGVIGFFADDSGRVYFMLSNIYMSPTGSATDTQLAFRIVFDSSVTSVWRLSRATGQVEELALAGDHSLSVTLPGGTGDLFNYDGQFAGANLALCDDENHPYPIGDLSQDCYVSLPDYGAFAAQWSAGACTAPEWCGGADFNIDGSVNIADLGVMASGWLDCTDPMAPCNYVP